MDETGYGLIIVPRTEYRYPQVPYLPMPEIAPEPAIPVVEIPARAELPDEVARTSYMELYLASSGAGAGSSRSGGRN
jgi:hypothetical protein